MSKDNIVKEMDDCKARINELRGSIAMEDDFSVRMAKIDEMIQVADRMYNLDTVHKGLIIAEYEAEVSKLTKQLMRDIMKLGS